MSTIATTSQPATSSPLKRLIRAHPLVAYFVIAFAGTWSFLLPFALSRNVNGLGILPFRIPDIALLYRVCPRYLRRAGPGIPQRDRHHVWQSRLGTAAAQVCAMARGHRVVSDRHFRLYPDLRWWPSASFYGVNLPLALLSKWTLIFTVFFPQAVFIILTASFAEELGWRGFALPRLQQRYGPVMGTVILGTLHGLWHLPAFFTLVLGPFSFPYYVGFLYRRDCRHRFSTPGSSITRKEVCCSRRSPMVLAMQPVV